MDLIALCEVGSRWNQYLYLVVGEAWFGAVLGANDTGAVGNPNGYGRRAPEDGCPARYKSIKDADQREKNCEDDAQHNPGGDAGSDSCS